MEQSCLMNHRRVLSDQKLQFGFLRRPLSTKPDPEYDWEFGAKNLDTEPDCTKSFHKIGPGDSCVST